jgi:hypothetical protein
MFRDEDMDVRPPSYRQRFVKEVWLWSEASESYSAVRPVDWRVFRPG